MEEKIVILLIFLIAIFIFVFYNRRKTIPEKIYLSESYYEKIGEFIEIDFQELETKKKENFILYTYNSYCSLPIPCDKIFKEFVEEYHINFLAISFSEFRKTSFYSQVRYAPSILIIQNQKIIAYLDANLEEDKEKYQDMEKLKDWLEKYIYLNED